MEKEIYFWPSIVLLFGTYLFLGAILHKLSLDLKMEKRWMAWIPGVNAMYLCRMAHVNQWLGWLLFLPYWQYLLGVWCWMRIAKRRHLYQWMGFFMCIPYFNFVIALYLTYTKPKVKKVPSMWIIPYFTKVYK